MSLMFRLCGMISAMGIPVGGAHYVCWYIGDVFRLSITVAKNEGMSDLIALYGSYSSNGCRRRSKY